MLERKISRRDLISLAWKGTKLFVVGTTTYQVLTKATGCDDGNKPKTKPPLFTTYPSLVHEENTVYADTIAASGNPTPTYTLVQSPPNMLLNPTTGDLDLAAVDSIRGAYPLEIRADNSEGLDQWVDTFRIVYDYVNAMTQLDIRGQEYAVASEFFAFESQLVPEQFPFAVGGGQDVYVDAQIAGQTIPGLFPLIVQYLGRPDKSQDILDLQNAGWDPIVIGLHTDYPGVGNMKEDFDIQCQTLGFSPPP